MTSLAFKIRNISLCRVEISSIGPHKRITFCFTMLVSLVLKLATSFKTDQVKNWQLCIFSVFLQIFSNFIIYYYYHYYCHHNHWKSIKLFYLFSSIERHISTATDFWNEFMIKTLLNYFTGSTAMCLLDHVTDPMEWPKFYSYDGHNSDKAFIHLSFTFQNIHTRILKGEGRTESRSFPILARFKNSNRGTRTIFFASSHTVTVPLNSWILHKILRDHLFQCFSNFKWSILILTEGLCIDLLF